MADISASGEIHDTCGLCDDTVGAPGLFGYLQGANFRVRAAFHACSGLLQRTLSGALSEARPKNIRFPKSIPLTSSDIHIQFSKVA